jgi:hypothetical protein
MKRKKQHLAFVRFSGITRKKEGGCSNQIKKVIKPVGLFLKP